MNRILASLLAALSLLLVSISTIFAGPAQAGPVVHDVRVGYDGYGTTRLVIFASRELDYSETAFVEGGLRYVLDFERVVWSLPHGEDSKGEGSGVGDIQRYRYAHFKPDVSRLVLDLDTPLIVDSAFSVPPGSANDHWRMVIDFKTTDLETFRALKPQLAAPSSQSVVQQRAPAGTPVDLVPRPAAQQDAAPLPVTPAVVLNQRPVVVIDAGHGGGDPGAIGVKKKTHEKDISLRAAIRLRDILVASKNYDVIMTRETDVYIDHDERIRIAREADADLFISIHADAAGNRSVQGASVYTLSEKGSRRLDSKIREESWGVPLEVHAIHDDPPDEEVEDILMSLMKREAQNHSAEFAEVLIPELAKAGPVLRNTHRRANYHVLLSANVPAVLLEVGFLTNEKDEERLLSSTGIERSMKAVEAAIDKYFETHPALHSRYQVASRG